MKMWAARGLNLALASALILLAQAASSTLTSAAGAMTHDQEQRMIRVLSRTPKTVLGELAGMTPEAAAKIVAWREKNYEFKSVEQIKEVSALPELNFEKLKAAFMKDLPKGKSNEADRSPNRFPAEDAKKGPGGAKQPTAKKANLGAPPTKSGQAAPGQPSRKLDISVRSNFYYDLPGYDLSGLTEAQRMAFLEAVNREMCSCGCEDETLGYCLVNDPGCPVVKARVRKLYKDMIGSDPVEPKEAKKP